MAADLDEMSLDCPDQVCAISSASMPPAQTQRSREQSDPTRKRPLLRRVRVPPPRGGGHPFAVPAIPVDRSQQAVAGPGHMERTETENIWQGLTRSHADRLYARG